VSRSLLLWGEPGRGQRGRFFFFANGEVGALFKTAGLARDLSSVFAVEEIAHGAAASGVGLAIVLKACWAFRGGAFGFGLAAGRTTVGEAGLIGLQFKLFLADDADSDRERHPGSHDKTGGLPEAKASEKRA
jgi:hypothetical protein